MVSNPPADSFRVFLNMIHSRHFTSSPLPLKTTVSDFYHTFYEICSYCIRVAKLSKDHEITEPEIQDLFRNDLLRSISNRFPSWYSFRRLSTDSLAAQANTIIDVCSTIASINKHLYFEDQTCSIAQSTEKMIKELINEMAIQVEISSFAFFDISDDLASPLPNSNMQSIERELFLERCHGYVCYSCNEHPAISIIRPCGHAFLCEFCVSEATGSIPPFCYICGQPISSISPIRWPRT